MANDLATLTTKLATQLRDTDHAVWAEAEKQDLLTWATRGLYPRYARAMVEPIWPLDPDTENYALPTGMMEVTRVEQGEVATDQFVRVLGPGTWYVYGNELDGGAALFVNRVYTDADYYLILHGFGRYDLVTNLPPDDFVPLILALARAEAYQRVSGERSRFLQWQASEQEQDTSVNELLGLIDRAEATALRYRALLPQTQRRPVPGRMG